MRAIIAEGVANRSSIFVTTKISPGTCTAAAALAAIRADLTQMALAQAVGTGQDLLLVVPFAECV